MVLVRQSELPPWEGPERTTVVWRPEGSHARATYQDLVEAPPLRIAELIDGVLYLESRPLAPHNLVRSALHCILGADCHLQRKAWWLLIQLEVRFRNPVDEDVLVPALAGWRRERLPQLTDPVTLAPDWVGEVLFPHTRELILTRKMDIYAKGGIPHLWLVDPEARTLEAYENQGGQWAPLANLTGDAPMSVAPFAAIDSPLSILWHD